MDGYEIKPALIVDLDGTIRFNVENPGGFINQAEEVAVWDDVEAKLWQYRDDGYLIFAVTNQGGVAHGYKTAEGVVEEIKATRGQFQFDPFHDVRAAYAMSNGSVHGYAYRSLLRKPQIGMLVELELDWIKRGVIVDWDDSLMVGDRDDDRSLANKAGIGFQWASEFFGRTK